MLRIGELRAAKNITQRQLAETIGVKNYTVGNWEQGRVKPDIGDLIALANYFECSVDYLIGREDDFGNIVLLSRISDDQTKLLGLYSRLPKEKQKIVLELLGDLCRANVK